MIAVLFAKKAWSGCIYGVRYLTAGPTLSAQQCQCAKGSPNKPCTLSRCAGSQSCRQATHPSEHLGAYEHMISSCRAACEETRRRA